MYLEKWNMFAINLLILIDYWIILKMVHKLKLIITSWTKCLCISFFLCFNSHLQSNVYSEGSYLNHTYGTKTQLAGLPWPVVNRVRGAFTKYSRGQNKGKNIQSYISSNNSPVEKNPMAEPRMKLEIFLLAV